MDSLIADAIEKARQTTKDLQLAREASDRTESQEDYLRFCDALEAEAEAWLRLDELDPTGETYWKLLEELYPKQAKKVNDTLLYD